jgi:hypothetical protein
MLLENTALHDLCFQDVTYDVRFGLDIGFIGHFNTTREYN